MKILRRLVFLGMVAAPLLLPMAVHAAPATVKFMSSDADLPAMYVEKFNKENPDRLTIVRTEPDYAKMVAEAAAGNASDLINLGSGSDIAYYVPRGLFKDLTKYFQKSKVIRIDDIDRLGNAEYQFDGKEFGKGAWYGLSKDYNNIGMITYNKQMFKAAGIPMLSETVPITYDELYQMAKKLTKKDSSGKVIVWGTDISNMWTKFLASDMATMSGISFYADAQKTKMNREPAMKDIWKYFARLTVEDIMPNVKNPAPAWTNSNFTSERVAIVQLGYWFGQQARSVPGFQDKFGWSPTPVVKKGGPRATNTLGATGVVMYAKSRVPDQAFKVFEWYMGGEYGQVRAKTGWGIPPLKSLLPLLPEGDAYDKSRKMIAFDDAKYFKPWQTTGWVPSTVWDDNWTKNIEPLVKGQITMDKFVDNYLDSMDKVIAEGKAQLGQ